MSNYQLNWAQDHDWYLAHSTVNGEITSITVRDDMTANTVLHFDDFDNLYVWAGY